MRLNRPRAARLLLLALLLGVALSVALVVALGCKEKSTDTFERLGSPACTARAPLANTVVLEVDISCAQCSGDSSYVLHADGRLVRQRESVALGAARADKVLADLEATGIANVPQGCWAADPGKVADGIGYAMRFRRAGRNYQWSNSSHHDLPKALEAAADIARELSDSVESELSRQHEVNVDAGLYDAPVGPLNVLLVSVDSMRADMPWAGYARPIAPRLSELHARSVSYAHAYSTSSYTSKSVAGLLTGRYPSSLARTGGFFTKYTAPAEFLCTALGAAELPCVGGHAHAYFEKGQSGFESGFAKWQLVPGIKFDYQTDPYVTSDKLTPLAVAMLGEVATARRPFFAWFHYMDPHDEYKSHPESPHFGKSPRDLYDEEIFFTDLWIGKLLDYVAAQPWADRTAIIVTADHGEIFGDHGMTRHAHELWEELVHVPLFIALPNVAPRVIEAPRGHVDLAPTIAELLGARLPAALPGTSLVGELRGGEAAPRDVIADLPEDEYNERRRALVHGRTKLIAFGNDVRFALYDLEADPREANELSKKRPELFEEMRARYREASRRIPEVKPTGGIPKHDTP